MRKVKFGATIPSCEEGLLRPIPYAIPSDVLEIAASAERFGFDSIWANDHITAQEYVQKNWPLQPPNYYEALITLSFAAQVTKKACLGLGIIPLPLRNPVVLAKQVATLDVFCGGRTVLGVGLGAYLEEFRALFPTMKKVSRAELLDESLISLVKLFTDRRATFNGKHIGFSEIELYPKPLQSPLPIYIGGNNEKCIERAARLGQGWLPASLSPSDIAKGVASIRSQAESNGRDPSKIDIAPQLSVCTGKTREDARRKYKNSGLYKHDLSLQVSTFKGQSMETFEDRDLMGSEDDVIKRVQEYIDAGTTNFAALIFVAETPAETIGEMKYFAERIMPSF